MSKSETRGQQPFVAFPKTLYDSVNAGRWTANQVKVVLVVIRYTVGHNGQSDGAYLSRRTIAEKAKIHERTVRTVMDGLVAQGVVREIEPRRKRRAAKLAMQTDSTKWGIHSPDAEPLRSVTGNPDKLIPTQFGTDSCGRGRPQSSEQEDATTCGRGRPPSAGVDARTNCGRGRADYEDVEDVLLKAPDSGSSSEPPLSALDEKKLSRQIEFCLVAKNAPNGDCYDVGLLGDDWQAWEMTELRDIVNRAWETGQSDDEMVAEVRARAERLEAVPAEAPASTAAFFAKYLSDRREQERAEMIQRAKGTAAILA
jgi:hypothetical protein